MKAILTFHDISDSGYVLSYPVKMFEQLLLGLLNANIDICSLDNLWASKSNHAVALTFDDGMESVHTHALPVLRDLQVPSHLYLMTSRVGLDNRWPGLPTQAPVLSLMNWQQLEECMAADINVENHTSSHPDLRKLSTSEIAAECDQADYLIESRLGKKPAHFAYPYGYYNDDVSHYIGQRFNTAVTTELRFLDSAVDMATVPRLDTYYLQHPHLFTNLFSITSRSYLLARYLMRKIRWH
jgi:peptidoglycan/xylan/chitin deacetylase (PgdA/CDA1 family)